MIDEEERKRNVRIRDGFGEFFICLRSNLSKDNINFGLKARGPFLESPGNFSGPKSNIQIQI